MQVLERYRNWLERKKGEKAKLEQELMETRSNLRRLKREQEICDKVLLIFKEVGLRIQNQLTFHISNITSLALQSVFSEPYDLKMEFVERHNKSECDLYFERDGERVKPMDESGGGVVDVASFALRVALWSMQKPRTRPVLILDEPFKNLSSGYLGNASEMLKELVDRLGLQIILVTHEEELIETSDKIFRVGIRKGKSFVDENKKRKER